MKIIPSILAAIIILSIIGIALYYSKTKSSSISELALWIQAIATVVLVLITGFYALETRQSRISQEEGFNKYVTAMEGATKAQKEGFDKYVEELQKSRLLQQEGVEKYIKELQESRKQEVKPNIYGLFYWCDNLGKFFLVLKNVGVGPAFEVKATYSTVDDNGKEIKKTCECGMLDVDKEKADNTHFSSEHMRMKNPVKIEVTYLDSFGQQFSNSYEHNLGKSANDPIPIEFADFRRKLENNFRTEDIRQWLQIFHKTLEDLQKDVKGIREKN